MIIALYLAAAVAAQQPRPARAPHAAAPAQGNFDSTVAAIADLGVKVGELRSVYDQYRRAAFNEQDGEVLERAAMFGRACATLADAARSAERTMCRSCSAARVQPAFNSYRANLPAMQRYAQGCAERVTRLGADGSSQDKARAYRNDAAAAGTRMIQALRVYEERLHAVRVVMGWDQAPPRPVR